MRDIAIGEIYRICYVMADIQMPGMISGIAEDAVTAALTVSIVMMAHAHLRIMVHIIHTVTIPESMSLQTLPIAVVVAITAVMVRNADLVHAVQSP